MGLKSVHRRADASPMAKDDLSWAARRMRRDALLGFGLVGLYVVAASGALGSMRRAGDLEIWPIYAVPAVMFALSVIMLILVRKSSTNGALIVFPILLWAGSVALSVVTDGVAPQISGFFALAMIYIGMMQRRRTVIVLVVLATPCWLISQEATSSTIWLRLVIVVVVWLAVGMALASQTRQDRNEASSLLVRATTDALTGLQTRTMLTEQIERELRRPTCDQSSLLLVDLDGFKGVNDMFGHAAGDELLIELARRMVSALRPQDVAARLGGDEFAVLLRGADGRTAAGVADRLLTTLAQPVALSRGHMAVTASIGVASLRGVTNPSDALREADLAMYNAKSTGKNRHCLFQREMEDRREARAQLEGELLHALDAQEFELYYQPAVHLHTGHVIGVEALLRWNHPQRGLLTPDQFLGASEQIGVIVALGDWILHQACRQAAAWQPRDPAHALTMAVNISAPEMLAPGFVDRVRAALEQSGLVPNLLVLEVSERLVLSDAPLVRDLIDALRHLGVRIAIDDFGTGRQSLAELRDLRVDILKIDRSFIQPLGLDLQSTALIKAIIAIANALHLDVVAEGVETHEQVDLLRDAGCQVAQGFHFSRPRSADLIGPQIELHRGGGIVGSLELG